MVSDPLTDGWYVGTPQRYLHHVLERIADHPINRIHELLPWNVATLLNQPAAVPEAMVA